MYCITDEQIDYILNDIRRNGVDMEDLQLNLLDHICCIIEQNLEENGDFEGFYHATVKQFYKNELREIEEETIRLLTFKNYYAMKKLMIVSGTFSAAAFVMGSLFKAMYWPGASILLVLAILTMTFVFLPLLFVLKNREVKTARGKWVLASGILTGILYALSVLFAIQHWPGGKILWFSTVCVSMFLFIPLYFFTGIKNAETRFNTIISSVLLVGATGILFTMLRIREPQPILMYSYIKNEQLLESMQRKMQNKENSNLLIREINNTCVQIKSAILVQEIGMPAIPKDYESKNILIKEKNIRGTLGFGQVGELFTKLKSEVATYNSTVKDDANKIPTDHSILDADQSNTEHTNLSVLNNMVQVQMFIANAQEAEATKVVTRD